MERSTIHYLKQKGWNNSQIAAAVGCHRDTVRRILREAVDHESAPRQRSSQIAVFDEAINGWLDENLSVRRPSLEDVFLQLGEYLSVYGIEFHMVHN